MTLTTTNTALVDLGLLDELRERDTQSHSHYVFRHDGAVLGYFGRAFRGDGESKDGGRGDGGSEEGDKGGKGDGGVGDGDGTGAEADNHDAAAAAGGPTAGGGRAQRGNLRVPREVLRRMLLERLSPGTVRWGERVEQYEDDADSATVAVTLASGVTVRCDVLVGAEGISSPVRRQKTGDELRYLGVMAVVGVMPLQHPLLDARGFYTVDGVHRLFTMPFAEADGDDPATTMWQLTFRCDEAEAARLAGLPRGELLEDVKRRVAQWHAPVHAMVTATDPCDVWADPLYDRDPMRPPRKGAKSRVAVVGDSCHPMSPFKGQGANTALWSAARLAQCIDTLPLSSAVAVYEREMLARASARVQASRDAVAELHSPESADPAVAPFGFCGVDESSVAGWLAFLAAEGVSAVTPRLDDAVGAALRRWRARGEPAAGEAAGAR